MITVDPREGSGKLAPKLEARGVMVRTAPLSSGDLQWFAEGPGGTMMSVGVEVKQLGEVVGDFLTPRFTGSQLPKMMEDYDRRYLMVVGQYRVSDRGAIQIPRGLGWQGVKLGGEDITYELYRHKLTTLQEQAQVTTIEAKNVQELLREVVALYRWWDMGFDRHGSLKVFYRPPAPTGLKRPTRYREALNALIQGVGWEKTLHLEKAFPTMESLLDAEVKDISQVKGIGPSLGKRIYGALRGIL